MSSSTTLSYPRPSVDTSMNHTGLSTPSPHSSPESAYSPQRYDDDFPTVIDTFSPKRSLNEMSPTSSISSEMDIPRSMHIGKSNLDKFLDTHSRVVRLLSVPQMFGERNINGLPSPVTMWTLRDDYPATAHEKDSVWAIFKSHEEACAILSLSGSIISALPALESDLEPFHKLRRFEINTVGVSSFRSIPRMSTSQSNLPFRAYRGNTTALKSDFDFTNPPRDYAISSNPPNPRTSFRLGDWICNSQTCAAHNFGRNLSCIGCGQPRGPPSPHLRRSQSPRPVASPRFVSSGPTFPSSSPPPQTLSSFPYSHPSPHATELHTTKPLGVSHPLLTPSGRAFSSGGKVQNVSSDPLAPCVMYWPDNEPLPEQGQIRPSGLTGVPQPPILNTGNRGPIEHQPGDWICLKCNYLNWRRRKVCQTCFPYAEGNGDSISAAVQAERIALLTSVLSQNETMPLNHSSHMTPSNSHGPRSQSLTPPQSQRPFVDVSPPKARGPVLRSQSHLDLSAQYADSRPIYQTSGYRQLSPSPFPSSAVSGMAAHMHEPAPLLPSFLQEIIQSPPTLSPESTSSADLSFEEMDETVPLPYRSPGYLSNDSLLPPPGNIWRLDGEESKTLSGLALPNSQDLMGNSRKRARDVLQPPAISTS